MIIVLTIAVATSRKLGLNIHVLLKLLERL